jgi:hypothetical protein
MFKYQITHYIIEVNELYVNYTKHTLLNHASPNKSYKYSDVIT